MEMGKEKGIVCDRDVNSLTVVRQSDKQKVKFIKTGTTWLLEKSCTDKSPLYGTRFVFENE